MKRKFITLLQQEVLKDLSTHIPCINHGGCGYFAIELYKVADTLGLKPKIITIGFINPEDKKLLKEGNGLAELHWNHFMVKIGGFYIDGKGVFTLSEAKYNWGGRNFLPGLKLEHLIEWIEPDKEISPYWNGRFERKKYVPVLSQMFENFNNKIQSLV